jgi:hypothetical protein
VSQNRIEPIVRGNTRRQISSRIKPDCYPKMMRHWFDAMTKLGLEHGSSFDLDFHTIPFHGEDALLEKHYIVSFRQACMNDLAEAGIVGCHHAS